MSGPNRFSEHDEELVSRVEPQIRKLVRIYGAGQFNVVLSLHAANRGLRKDGNVPSDEDVLEEAEVYLRKRFGPPSNVEYPVARIDQNKSGNNGTSDREVCISEEPFLPRTLRRLKSYLPRLRSQ